MEMGFFCVKIDSAVMYVGIANTRWRGKGSQQRFRRMRNPQFKITGKRPIVQTYEKMVRTISELILA